MTNELTYPCLPCRDIDEAITFYAALGFQRTYRQLRPNPCAVVRRDDWHIHLFGMPEFDPATSYGSVIVVVPDPDALYKVFADGLRAAYGKLPSKGIPRILRPRKKYGTIYGFSVVDVGGNWLRISKGVSETEEEAVTGLASVLNVAARLGDAHGDDEKALKTIQNGLKRYADTPSLTRAQALLYQAELALRIGNINLANSSLTEFNRLPLSDEERSVLAMEVEHVEQLIKEYQA
jgi:catechol 2,3-dioxygenase-like lactoylglutathione lyase family enzyme